MKKLMTFGIMLIFLISIVSAYGGGGTYVLPAKLDPPKTTDNGEMYELKVLDKINKNSPRTIEIDESDLLVKEVTIKTKKDYKGVSLLVQESNDESSPKNIKVKTKFEISTNIRNEDLFEVTFQFTLDREYVENHKWIFYHETEPGKWIIEKTELVEENRNYNVYKATVDHLSLFAVAGTELKKVTTTVAPTTTTKKEEIKAEESSEVVVEEPEIILGDQFDAEEYEIEPEFIEEEPKNRYGMAILWIVLIMCVIAAFVLEMKERKKEEKK